MTKLGRPKSQKIRRRKTLYINEKHAKIINFIIENTYLNKSTVSDLLIDIAINNLSSIPIIANNINIDDMYKEINN